MAGGGARMWAAAGRAGLEPGCGRRRRAAPTRNVVVGCLLLLQRQQSSSDDVVDGSSGGRNGTVRAYGLGSLIGSPRSRLAPASGRAPSLSEAPGKLPAMGRLSQFDADALARLLARQTGVISRSQALGCAMTESAIRHRIRADGPWLTILPGIYLTGQRVPTTKQRVTAAYLYAGKPIAVTGPAALAWYSLPTASSNEVDVLVPLECRRRDAQFARLHRTGVVPDCGREGVVRYASPARAVADAVRQLTSIPDVRAVVAGGVQRGKITVADLARELTAGPVQGSARLRMALAEVADGVRSAAEGDLRALIRRERLPAPMFNARLFAGGQLVAIPDAWWPQACVAAEVDSREWHLSPADWEKTLARDTRLAEHGIVVMRFPPRRIRTAGKEVADQIRSALAASGSRQLPEIVALPAA